MFILPVRATSTYFIEGDSITVHPGARVWFEVFACNWNPDNDNPPLRLYQFKTLPPDVYGSPSIQPPLGSSCQTSGDCQTVFGTGSQCDDDTGTYFCEHGFVDTTRADWMFADCSEGYLVGVDLSIPQYIRMGSILEPAQDCTIDDGEVRYLATFVYDIPDDAPLSPITIPLNEGESFLQNSATPPDNDIPVEMFPAYVKLYPALPRSRHVPLNIPQAAVPEGSTAQALRVTMTALHHPDPPYTAAPITDYSNFESQIRWVGQAGQFNEGVSPDSLYNAAPLQCDPHFADWTALGWVYAYGVEVLPSSTYTVDLVDSNCPDLGDSACYQTLFTYRTGAWGDIVEPLARPGGSHQPDFADIGAAVDKFRNALTAVQKSRVQMQPHNIDPAAAINFSDISMVVDAFRGKGYDLQGPANCP